MMIGSRAGVPPRNRPTARPETNPGATPGPTVGSAGPARGLAMGGRRRGVQLVLGLLAFTLSMAMMLHAGRGGTPWDVLHQGVVRTTGWSFGVTVAVSSVLVLCAWAPLRQRPGIGTLANVVVIALTIEPCLALVAAVVPDPGPVAAVVLACGGIVLNGVATAAYVGVHLGPGPRDGLLTGIVARSGWSVRLVKTGIEVTVVVLGWALGGTLGWATVAYALGVGVVVQTTTRWRWLVPAGLTVSPPTRFAVPPAVPRPAVPHAVVPHADGPDAALRRRAARIERALAVVRAEHGESPR
ncbi:YczE/YyaS/YitT family protein [Isoptericola jiangsuensis]|uniref:membrane protein YczE n=1 Tax=Isoptericola jiangsuensis TaxID=548579 RepID=UPI003AACFCC1